MEPSLHDQYLRFSRNELKAEELENFLHQLTLPENREIVHEWMDETWNELVEMPANKIHESPVVSIYNLRRIQWKRWIAAASVILVLALGSYFLFTGPSADQNKIVENQDPIDIKAPAANRAMITLANGQTIYLDSAGNGTLLSVDGVSVVKNNEGVIVYQSTDQLINLSTQYHTLTNPKGSKVIDMTMSDGSRVWLNAGSSVTYPVAFNGNERKVEISGEAYFEIAHDASKPFKVTKENMEIAVLGTHFNVNAYDDEAEIKITLLEGSVKVSTTKLLNASTILKPGQQAVLTLNTKPSTLNNVDLESVMAWKNGLFTLKGTGLEDLMRQVSRWYDVDIVYTGKIPERKFGGTISRKVNLNSLLRALNEQGVNVKLEGRKVIVGDK